MPGRIFVTGGSGFVGSAVIAELLSRGYSVNALQDRKPIDPRGGRVNPVPGGLFDSDALDQGMKDVAGVIHIVGIIRERRSKGMTFDRVHHQGTRAVVDAARRNGVKRYVHMSALGTRPGAVSDYHKTKYLAEEYVRASGLDWTIFRPSVIHGLGGEFMQMEADWVRFRSPPFLFMPYFGAGAMGNKGAGRLQPVHVGDVAKAFVDALENPKTVGEVYLLGGSETVTWPQMHRTVSTAMRGKPRWVMAIPAWKAGLLTRITPGALLPFNRDQVVMSQEDNTCDLGKFVDDFGWKPRGLSETLPEYAKQL